MCIRDRNNALVQAIQIAGGLVQQQKLRVVQEGPGKPQPLPLPAGERISQLPHRRVIPLGQGQDKFVYRSLLDVYKRQH